MKIKYIVRARGGTSERRVAVSEILVPDVRSSMAIQFRQDRANIYRLFDDLTALLDVVRRGAELPNNFYVPDLWHSALSMPPKEEELVLELWQLSHDLAREIGFIQIGQSDKAIQQDFGSLYLKQAPEYDAFISHASEDKDCIVRELAESLTNQGFRIWYDEFALRVGDSLRKLIDEGLANSRFGIVILSPNFFAKQWTEYELNGLVAREMVGGKVVLPIWHNVSKHDVLAFSPSLADKIGISTSTNTIAEIAEKLSEVLHGE